MLEMEFEEYYDEDEDYEVLNPLLADANDSALEQPRLKRFRERLISFLSLKDLKILRLVNQCCNNWILTAPKFPQRYVGVISESWHNSTQGLKTDATLLWKYLNLEQFGFRRNSNIFANYFGITSVNLKELTIFHSSLDSEGFSCLLYRSPHLRSLTLDSVKLRETDRVFAFKTLEEHINLPINSYKLAPEALRMRQSLKHLKLCNMYIMDDLSLYHLVSRSGFLQSLTIEKCVNYNLKVYDPLRKMNKNITLEQRIEGFMKCILKIVDRNADSLRKLCLDDNNFPESSLGILNPVFMELRLKELKLNLTKSSTASPFLVLSHLITPEMQWSILEKFSLEFDGKLSVENLASILEKAGNTLKEFRFIMRENQPGNVIELHSHLSKLKVLEKVYIKDCNNVKSWKKNYPDSTTRAQTSDLSTYRSNVDYYQILSHLPGTVTELSICHIIAEKNLQSAFAMYTVPEGLTKLEIRGPTLIPFGSQFRNLISQMKKLRSLLLPNCDLTDAHLTGLPHETSRIIRNCFTYLYMVDNYIVDPNANGINNLKIQADLLKNKNKNSKDKEFRFSELPDLVHLDLSFNPGITDVSVLYTLSIPKLKTLNMEYCDKITDAGLEMITKQLPALEEFNLRNCRAISRHGLNRLVHGCRSLKKIYTTKIIQEKDHGIPVKNLSKDFDSIIHFGRTKEDVLQARDVVTGMH